MRISDWSSDVCSSDLRVLDGREIEEIAAVERDTVAMVARAHAEVGRRDQAAAFGEGTAFRAHEEKIDAVREQRIGTPYRFDHFHFRSEEGRVGKECGGSWRYRWSPMSVKKKTKASRQEKK